MFRVGFYVRQQGLQLLLQDLCIDSFGEPAILLTQILRHYPNFLDRS